MQDYGLTVAQRQYDSAEPPRYNRKPKRICCACGAEIYANEKYAVVYGTFNYCMNCIDFETAEEDEDE